MAAEGARSATIEVEKKIFLTATQRKALAERSDFHVQDTESFWDTYYDGPGFSLTCKDLWLRKRDSAWELKVPWESCLLIKDKQTYEEVVEEREILEKLKHDGIVASSIENNAVPEAGRLEEACHIAGILPFARLHTERVSLRADPHLVSTGESPLCLRIDLDTVHFDASFAESVNLQQADLADCPFVVAELEVLAPNNKEAVDSAAIAIDNFLLSAGLETAPKAYSKLLEYLIRFRPQHVEQLSLAGLLPKEKMMHLRAAWSAQCSQII